MNCIVVLFIIVHLSHLKKILLFKIAFLAVLEYLLVINLLFLAVKIQLCENKTPSFVHLNLSRTLSGFRFK